MTFVVAFRYRRKDRIFIVKAEKDEIFIAFPRKDRVKDEPIFLTKAGRQWVGDSDDKNLVSKIGREIDHLRQSTDDARKNAALN